MQTFVQLATDDEHTGGRQAVSDHLDHRPLVSQLATGVDGDQHKAHMGNGGVGNQTFDIGLCERHPGTVEDTNHTQPHGDRGKLGGRVREQRQAETQQAVGRRLQQDPRQVDRTRRWCLAMRIRQPTV
ncbi:hypothetical protein D3C79_802500 [compost metagenome]